MILYTKTFPLGKGISFARYINILDENSFPPFTLLIKKTPGTKKVLIEIVLTDIAAFGVLGGSPGFGRALFNEVTIEYLEGRNFILQASVRVGSLLLSFFYIVLAAFFLSVILFVTVVFSMSLEFLFIMLLILVLMLYPLMSTYFREIKFLDRIGSLGSDMDEK